METPPVLSLADCLNTLVFTATGDGNLLLDVGLNELGEIPSNQVERFLQIGERLKKYGFTIYGTRGGLLRYNSRSQDKG